MKIKLLELVLKTFYKDTAIVKGVKWDYRTGLRIKAKNVLLLDSKLAGNKVIIKTPMTLQSI